MRGPLYWENNIPVVLDDVLLHNNIIQQTCNSYKLHMYKCQLFTKV